MTVSMVQRTIQAPNPTEIQEFREEFRGQRSFGAGSLTPISPSVASGLHCWGLVSCCSLREKLVRGARLSPSGLSG